MVKATIIGGEVRKVGPTPLFGLAPTPLAQPTAFKPTALPAGAAPTPHIDVKATPLPGMVRKTLDVPTNVLLSCSPNASTTVCEHARAILAGITPEVWGTTEWLNYGVEVQEEVADLIKERLALLDDQTSRTIPPHLSRMHRLLNEAVESLKGGFMRKPNKHGWKKNEPELKQIAGLLEKGSEKLFATLSEIDSLIKRSSEKEVDVQASTTAADYLLTILPQQKAELLQSRAMALLTSHALLQEHVFSLQQDIERVKELIKVVQNGVLIQLPSVITQLANTPDEPTDTQQFLAVDKLSELIQLLDKEH